MFELDHKWYPLVQAVCNQHKLDLNHTGHGLDHWCRVIDNGLRLSAITPNVDRDVIIAFGFLHDSGRTHDEHCEVHGKVAGVYVMRELDVLIPLTNEQKLMVSIACINHTSAQPGEFPLYDETLLTCFDADRLDLWRVGILPCNKYLFTDAAKTYDFQLISNTMAENRSIPSWALPLFDLVGL